MIVYGFFYEMCVFNLRKKAAPFLEKVICNHYLHNVELNAFIQIFLETCCLDLSNH